MKKHLFRRVLRSLRSRSIYKKIGLPLGAIEAIYRGRIQQSVKNKDYSFYNRNPTLDDFIKNFGTEKGKLGFNSEPLTAEETATAESKWLKDIGISINPTVLQGMTTRQFYATYRDQIDKWIDDIAPVDNDERQRFISTRIFGSK